MEVLHTEIRPRQAETDVGRTLPAEEKRMLVTGHSLVGQKTDTRHFTHLVVLQN
jgi:hypothetical protein